MNVMKPERKDFFAGVALALFAVVLWSGNFIVARGLSNIIPPVSLAFIRWLIATVVLLPFAWPHIGPGFKYVKQHWLYFCATALTGVSLFNTFVYIAGKHVTAVNMALIGTTAAPVFVLLLSSFLKGQRTKIFQWLGTIICILGILLLISGGSIYGMQHFKFTAGDWWILAAALSFAIYTILVRSKPKEMSPTGFLFFIFLIGTVFLLPAYLLQANENSFAWSRTNVLVFLYLGIGASVMAFYCWNLSIKKLGPARTALFGNLIPVFSTIEAAFLLNEKFTRTIGISFIVILAGLLVANSDALMAGKNNKSAREGNLS